MSIERKVFEWDILTAISWIAWRDEERAADAQRLYREVFRPLFVHRCSTDDPNEEAIASQFDLQRRLISGEIVCRGTAEQSRAVQARNAIEAVGVHGTTEHELNQLVYNDDDIDISPGEWRLRRIRGRGAEAIARLTKWEGRAYLRPPEIYRNLRLKRRHVTRIWPAKQERRQGNPGKKRETVKEVLKERFPPDGGPGDLKGKALTKLVNAALGERGEEKVSVDTVTRAVRELRGGS